jgi:hypothetical protein
MGEKLMENGNGSSHETGFKAMSQNADTSGRQQHAERR